MSSCPSSHMPDVIDRPEKARPICPNPHTTALGPGNDPWRTKVAHYSHVISLVVIACSGTWGPILRSKQATAPRLGFRPPNQRDLQRHTTRLTRSFLRNSYFFSLSGDRIQCRLYGARVTPEVRMISNCDDTAVSMPNIRTQQRLRETLGYSRRPDFGHANQYARSVRKGRRSPLEDPVSHRTVL